MKRYSAVLTGVFLSVVLLFYGCSGGAVEDASSSGSSDSGQTQETAAESPELLSLTLSELEQYNGQDGMPAYIAVDGNIYDVSAVSAWTGGKHNGYFAGKDVTEPIKSVSPHGIRVLQNLPLVGTIKE